MKQIALACVGVDNSIKPPRYSNVFSEDKTMGIKLYRQKWPVIIALVVSDALLLLLVFRHPFAAAASAPLHGAFAPRNCVSAATCAPPPDAFLKINQFYVLFTYPVVPHRDPSGTFIVGLDALAKIMEAHTRINAASKTETLFLLSHSITFVDGASTATVDGKLVDLPVSALWDTPSGKMIVPLSPILAAFHIPSHWDAAHKILTLQDKTFLTTLTNDPDTLNLVWRTQAPSPSDYNRNDLVPTSMKWFPVRSSSSNFDLTVQNVSGKTIPRGRNHVNFVYGIFGSGGYPITQYASSIEGAAGPFGLGAPILLPPLPAGASRTVTQGPVESLVGSRYTLCVLAWLVVTGK